jgi:hypothetical protein
MRSKLADVVPDFELGIKEGQMNRSVIAIVLAAFALLLVACGGAAPTPEPPLVVESDADVQRITAEDAKALLDSGEAILLDARSAAAYEAAHAAGSISFPASDAAARSGELPADKSLVFY